jgi:hypothetical protein
MSLDGSGATFEIEGGPVWSVTTVSAEHGGMALRAFGRDLWTANPIQDVVARIPLDGSAATEFAFDAGSWPSDVLVAGGSAYVALHNDARLQRIALASGEIDVAADLSVFAEKDETLEVGTLARDPAEAGVQGIPLQGAPPRCDMQVHASSRTLFVSTTGNALDGQGGIEMVDLDAQASIGFALTEDEFGADLGGFVMTSRDDGYFLFHTDIVASTHLKPFSITGGVPPGFEIVVLLGDSLDSLAWDPKSQRLFLPSGWAFVPSSPAVFAVNARRDVPLEPPIAMPIPIHDVIAVE